MMLPQGYKRLDYIQSDGNQYIDTGILFNNNNIRGTIDYIHTVSSKEQWIVGAINSSYTGGVEGGIYNYSFYTGMGVTYNQANILSRTIATLSTLGLTSTNTNIYLFARNAPNMYCSSIKLYSAKFYISDTLIRDFIPAKRLSDDAIGLLDKVNDVFYENQGTGEFTYGHILEENIVLEDNPLSFELQDNVELQANFELAGCQVTTQVNPLGSGTTSGDGVYSEGTNVTLSATPNQGNQFVNWTLNGVEVSTNPSYTFAMGNVAQTYVANFRAREWINCIYDRTQEDIEQRTSKAFINVNDWNRIENNLDFLSVRYQTTNVSRYWSYTDIPTNQKISTLLSKLNVLKAKVSESPSLPTTILNYTQVNQIEYFLYFMFDYYFNRIQIISQPISGFYNANEPNVLMATRP